MKLSEAKHQEYLGLLKNRVLSRWNQNADGAAYEVDSGGSGRFLFYKKNQGSEERTQIATIHLTGAGGTMQQNANAPKDLNMLKASAWHMCEMLNNSNPTGKYKLTFTGPDADAIKAYVQTCLQKKQLASKFTLVGGDAPLARPSVLAKDLSAPSVASQQAGTGHNEQRSPSPRGF